MAVRAYVLVEVAVGRIKDVADTLKGIEGIQSADMITGPYDVVAVIDAPDMATMGRLVDREVHVLDGVVRTVTCLSLDS